MIKRSREVAIDLGEDFISSYHFLLAVISFKNLPHAIFLDKQLDFEHLKQELQKEKLATVPDKLYVTIEFEKSLIISGYYSWVFYENVIKPEHVILAMLADKRSYAGSYLKAVGITYTDFESQLKPVKKRRWLGMIGQDYFLVRTGFVKFVYNIIIASHSNRL